MPSSVLPKPTERVFSLLACAPLTLRLSPQFLSLLRSGQPAKDSTQFLTLEGASAVLPRRRRSDRRLLGLGREWGRGRRVWRSNESLKEARQGNRIGTHTKKVSDCNFFAYPGKPCNVLRLHFLLEVWENLCAYQLNAHTLHAAKSRKFSPDEQCSTLRGWWKYFIIRMTKHKSQSTFCYPSLRISAEALNLFLRNPYLTLYFLALISRRRLKSNKFRGGSSRHKGGAHKVYEPIDEFVWAYYVVAKLPDCD